MSEYTSEDFARSRFAEHRHGATATRNGDRGVWIMSNGSGVMSDDDMALDGGWRPVAEPRTPEQDLRDRIAKVLCDTEVPYHDRGKAMAQAIIDDLGLVVESTVRSVEHGMGRINFPESRVVGKWEFR